MPPLEAANPGLSASSQTRFSGLFRRLILALLLAIGLAIRLLCLTCKPFWFDECFSVELARVDWRSFLHILAWREANMSLYYLLLRGWLHFGQSPFFIRSLSAVIATGTVAAIYWLARSLYDRRVALIAAALFTFNAYDVRYAQEARSYTLFVLLGTLSSGFLAAWLRQPTRRNWIGYAITSSLAMYAHLYALLLIAAQWLAVTGLGALDVAGDAERRSREIRRACITVGVAVSPLILFVAKTGTGPIRWIHRPTAREILELFEHLAGGTSWVLLLIMVAAVVVAVAPLRKHVLARANNWETWREQFLLIWLLFPVALTVLLSFAKPVFLGRYMIFCIPPFLILASAGLARVRRWWLLAAILSLVLFLSCDGILYVYGNDFDNERDASGAAAEFILNHTQVGDGIIFHIAGTRIPYEFFRSLRAKQNTASPKFGNQLGPEILFPNHGPGLSYEDFTGKPSPELVRAAAVTHSRVWLMLMNNGPIGDPDPTTVMLTQSLSQSFPKAQHWKFWRVEVQLYSRE